MDGGEEGEETARPKEMEKSCVTVFIVQFVDCVVIKDDERQRHVVTERLKGLK